jgi:hypothetical protein
MSSAPVEAMRIATQETRLDLLRRLLAENDAPDLQSPSGKGRGHAVLHAGFAGDRVDATAGTKNAAGKAERSCAAA